MRNVGIHGSYFAKNFGDVLLWRIMASLAQDSNPQLRIHTINIPAFARAAYCDGLSGIENASRGTELDGIVFCGGGYLCPPAQGWRRWSLRNFLRHREALGRARRAKKVAVVGVGLGVVEFAPLRWAISRAFENADVLMLRDAESKEALNSYALSPENCAVIPDMAYTHVAGRRGEARAREYIGIHADFSGLTPGRVQMFLRECRKAIEVLRLPLKFFIDCNSESAASSTRMAKEELSSLGAGTVVFEHNCDDFLAEISSCYLVLTTKLHVGICATAYQIPVMAFPKHVKTQRFYDQLGLGHQVVRNDTEAERFWGMLKGTFAEAGDQELLSEGQKAMDVCAAFFRGFR